VGERYAKAGRWSGRRLVGFGSTAGVVGSLMARPVCPQLRKCRVCPGSYAWCHIPTLTAAEMSRWTFTGDQQRRIPALALALVNIAAYVVARIVPLHC
jgi:hypothetical protein